MLDNKLVKIAKVELIHDAPAYRCIPGVILAKDEKGYSKNR